MKLGRAPTTHRMLYGSETDGGWDFIFCLINYEHLLFDGLLVFIYLCIVGYGDEVARILMQPGNQISVRNMYVRVKWID
jgi:uncharacterized membrane protein